MGIGSSYLRIRTDKNLFTARFIFADDDGYCKVVIAAGHPDNAFCRASSCSSEDYNASGEWYTYDGNHQRLKQVLTSFEPRRQDRLTLLMARLETECDMKKYKTTWEVITEWAEYVIEHTPATFWKVARSWILGGGWGGARLPPPTLTPYLLSS